FFSSRRRHTRSKRDWSSDVCSSDLRHGLEIDYPEKATPAQKAQLNRALERVADTTLDSISSTLARSIRPDYERFEGRLDASVTRSEERRVGKEWRDGRSTEC